MWIYLHWDLTVSQGRNFCSRKNVIFSHYCYKRDDLCQILIFAQSPCEMLAVKSPSLRPSVVFPQTPKRHQADYQATKGMNREGWLQTLTRNKNEKTAECCVDQCYPRQAHECAFVEEFPIIQVSANPINSNQDVLNIPYKGLLDFREVHKSVLAVSN